MIANIIASRKRLAPAVQPSLERRIEAAEGGCGVIGIACSEQIAGRHLLQSLIQMRNRGNGKGGGVAIVGLRPDEFGVSKQVLEEDYLYSVAYLEAGVRSEVEQNAILPTFEIDHIREQPHLANLHELNGLEVPPPEVVHYFVRVRPEIAAAFREEHQLSDLSQRQVEDEVVYQNTYRLNVSYYASMGHTRAFVLSHGKNMLVLKMVGYGDDVVRYYQLEDTHAHVWIGHHRYPTKGRVWHPGGAHPFIGLNEALVHNGDFANYASVSEYLAQRNIFPLFLTDTEVSVQVFDLLHRTYRYPLEYVIEALAPTTERDFSQLPAEKQVIYRRLQSSHIHGSPDGPWFFLIAQSQPGGMGTQAYNLIGITDTSMLRPQVFALQQSSAGGPAIGLAASEKQGIDAALESLAAVDGRFWSRADRYWNARGGSHTDGGAFVFSVVPHEAGCQLTCQDKFGVPVEVDVSRPAYLRSTVERPTPGKDELAHLVAELDRIPAFGPTKTGQPSTNGRQIYQWFSEHIIAWDYKDLRAHLEALGELGPALAIETLTLLMDRRYPTGNLRRSSLLTLYDDALNRILRSLPDASDSNFLVLSAGQDKPSKGSPETTLVIEARGFAVEGPDSLARTLVSLYERGYRRFIIANTRGHRFIANGFGPNTSGVRIDVYGSPGDYLASGIDGIEVHVHGSGQDQLAQIMKSGKLVVHGDVGQTFGYAAKGGEVYILGNAAGRPMINAVGHPKVVINGTCLDYLAEFFMAGDPLNGGGFVILNGLKITDQGEVVDLDTPYPGGNLFSLASGGALYVRDPHKLLGADQLNGGEFASLEQADWMAIRPCLEENARIFDLPVEHLLGGQPPEQVYRKIRPKTERALQAEEAWVHKAS